MYFIFNQLLLNILKIKLIIKWGLGIGDKLEM